ncbi:MAG: thermonuclease family protein [Deltaproteobacteria bacterium]|nr:thermonuclease family protein [Deltaproteobacteria bacterium]
MKTYLAAAVTCLAISASVSAATESRKLTGTIIRAIDGDTLELLAADNEPVMIRLAQIDAPEKSQPYGDRATKALAALILGKRVRVEVVTLDRYGRTVGEVYAGDTHINAEMVRRGHAWAYTRYVETLAIIELEDEARRHERGLWQLPLAERDAPWVWRHRRRGPNASEPEAGPPDTVCGEKRTCKEMVNCAEAHFYLLECGLTRLDGDGDGIPCESKCRE